VDRVAGVRKAAPVRGGDPHATLLRPCLLDPRRDRPGLRRVPPAIPPRERLQGGGHRRRRRVRLAVRPGHRAPAAVRGGAGVPPATGLAPRTVAPRGDPTGADPAGYAPLPV